MATLSLPSPPAKLADHRPSLFLRKRPPVLPLRCSAAEAELGDGSGNGVSIESTVGTSKAFTSLISLDNVQKALRGIAITDVDHYGRLGITRETSYDEVIVAYKKKCEELMNQDLVEEDAGKKMKLLKESFEILSSEEERRLYDWSLSRSENPDTYMWPFEVDITQKPQGTPPPQEPEDIEPTRLVGYFLLAWVFLSFVLSVTLNR